MVKSNVLLRSFYLVASLALGWFALACSGSGLDLAPPGFRFDDAQPFDANGSRIVSPTSANPSQLAGPIEFDPSDEAALAQLTWTVLDGPGRIGVRVLHENDDGSGTPLNEVLETFNGRQDDQGLFLLDLADGPIGIGCGFFSQQFSGRIYIQVFLPEGEADTVVDVRVQVTNQAGADNFDTEPNNFLAQAVSLDLANGLFNDSRGALANVIGDTADTYRVTDQQLANTLQVLSESQDQVTVELLDENGTVLSAETGTQVNGQPLFGELPVLGRLFRVRQAEEETRSLLYLIRADLVSDE